MNPLDVRVFIKLEEGNIKIITLKGTETEVAVVESMTDFINSKFVYVEKADSYSLISLLKDINNDLLLNVLNYNSPTPKHVYLFNEEKANKIASTGVKLLKSITSKSDKHELHFENKEILIGPLLKNVILSKVYITFETLCNIFDIDKSRVELIIKNHNLYLNVIGDAVLYYGFVKTLKCLYKEINIIEEETTDSQIVENKEIKHHDDFYLSPKLQHFIRQTLSLKISNSSEYIVMSLKIKQDGDGYVIKCEFDDRSTETDVLLTDKYDLNHMLSEIKKYIMMIINSILINEYTIDSEVIHSSKYSAHKKDYASISYVFSKNRDSI